MVNGPGHQNGDGVTRLYITSQWAQGYSVGLQRRVYGALAQRRTTSLSTSSGTDPVFKTTS